MGHLLAQCGSRNSAPPAYAPFYPWNAPRIGLTPRKSDSWNWESRTARLLSFSDFAQRPLLAFPRRDQMRGFSIVVATLVHIARVFQFSNHALRFQGVDAVDSTPRKSGMEQRDATMLGASTQDQEGIIRESRSTPRHYRRHTPHPAQHGRYHLGRPAKQGRTNRYYRRNDVGPHHQYSVSTRSPRGSQTLNEGRGPTPGDTRDHLVTHRVQRRRSTKAGGRPPATRDPVGRAFGVVNPRSTKAGGRPPATPASCLGRIVNDQRRSTKAGGRPPATRERAPRAG